MKLFINYQLDTLIRLNISQTASIQIKAFDSQQKNYWIEWEFEIGEDVDKFSDLGTWLRHNNPKGVLNESGEYVESKTTLEIIWPDDEEQIKH